MSSSRKAWLAALTAAVLVAGLTPARAAAEPSDHATVSAGLLTALDADGTTGFLVYLRDKADLSPAASLPRSRRAQRITTDLQATAESSQKPVRALLDERKATYKPFWIANVIWVQGDKALVEDIAKIEGVERIDPSRTHPLEEPAAGTEQATVDAVEWGVANIKAPDVWTGYGDRGEGVVVANIDSGVRFDHPALVGKYRGNSGGTFDHNYNWFDPAGICPDPAPCDNNDHGTHTMGTMVGGEGANQIGVAPGAKWIAAKGCEVNTCSDPSLLAAGQWIIAPTDLNGANPRPDLHPDVVNNSWGDDGGDLWFAQTIDAWIAAGIFPMFSNGNDGPACGSAGSPGDNAQSYSAGAYDSTNTIASFSGRGASAVDGGLKPNIAAPGVNVRSSVPGGYGAFSGTSMAAPHVAGTVALLWSAAPTLRGDIAATRSLLDASAVDVANTTCGGTAADNNVFGEGRLDAWQAVTLAPRGPSGSVVGTVRDDSTGTPIAGATVSSGARSATTAADGTYTLTLPAGEQPVTASMYGYHDATATVTVVDGGTASQDFSLVPAPMVTVSGKVTDGSGHGWPLYARIDVAGRTPVFTDPFTGRYTMTLPGNATHTLTTSAKIPGYKQTSTLVVLGSTEKTVNLALPVAADCTAPGYAVDFSDPLLSEPFDTTNTPAGWSVVNHQGVNAVWAFDDPGHRGNLTGGTGGFAIMDSDAAGSGKTEDTSLVTPVLDLSGANLPYLRFHNDFRAFSTSFGDVDVSTDGVTWTTVLHQSLTPARGPRLEQLALPSLAGAATAQIRFHYKGTFAWWWAVDDVELVDRGCAPAAGGLLSGFVTDANTAAGLTGAKIVSADVPAETAVSVATPDDPAAGDAYYWLFSSVTGAHSFTATKSPYNALTKSVTIVADTNKHVDFALKSARLTVAPTTIQAFQPYGSVRKTSVTVTNTGTAAATVDVLERSGGFGILRQTGADLLVTKLPGKASMAMRGVTGSTAGLRSASPTATWASIADYPDEVFDNAAATLNGKIYSAGGGIDTGMETTAYVYDPDAEAWTRLANMPHERAKPQLAAVGGKLYVLGGWSTSGDPVGSVDVFDPATGAWSTVAGAVNPAPRAAAGVGVAGGKIYLVGGCADDSCTSSDETVIFEPATGAFTAGPAYPQTVAWMSCGGIGARIYCAGGSGDADYTNGFALNPATASWTPIADAPLDLWGSAGSAAGGQLVLAGGVTAGSTAITNRTVAYDPVANTWSDAPNAQFARYRGAGSCGAYKIGGSPTSFVGSTESEVLPGLAECDEIVDVPWLSETPTTFTLGAGQSRTVTVTLTATAEAGVAQPGKYTAEFGLRAQTPYPITPVSVEMNVSPPTSWGKIQGSVEGLSCSGAHVGVKATIRLNLISTPGVGYTLHADAQGGYAWWLPKGTYQVIVAKDGWIPQATTVKIEAGIVRTAGFLLDPDPPCPSGI